MYGDQVSWNGGGVFEELDLEGNLKTSSPKTFIILCHNSSSQREWVRASAVYDVLCR